MYMAMGIICGVSLCAIGVSFLIIKRKRQISKTQSSEKIELVLPELDVKANPQKSQETLQKCSQLDI